MENKVTSPAIKGIIISLIFIVFSLVVQFINLSKNKVLGVVLILVLMVAIIWCCVSYANQMKGNVTYGDVFTHGFKTAAAVTAIMVVFTIISLKFINPESYEMALQEARAQMESKPGITESQIETGMNFTKKFFIPLTAGYIIVVYLVAGVIGSLIGAAVAKKNPNGPFVQQA